MEANVIKKEYNELKSLFDSYAHRTSFPVDAISRMDNKVLSSRVFGGKRIVVHGRGSSVCHLISLDTHIHYRITDYGKPKFSDKVQVYIKDKYKLNGREVNRELYIKPNEANDDTTFTSFEFNNIKLSDVVPDMSCEYDYLDVPIDDNTKLVRFTSRFENREETEYEIVFGSFENMMKFSYLNKNNDEGFIVVPRIRYNTYAKDWRSADKLKFALRYIKDDKEIVDVKPFVYNNWEGTTYAYDKLANGAFRKMLKENLFPIEIRTIKVNKI